MKNEMSLTYVQELNLDREDLLDIVCCAIEGGIGYWACLDNTTPEFKKDDGKTYDEIIVDTILDGGAIRFLDQEDDDAELFLTYAALKNGIGKWIYWRLTCTVGCYAGIPLNEGRLDTACIDAMDGDVIFQCALLDGIVYC